MKSISSYDGGWRLGGSTSFGLKQDAAMGLEEANGERVAASFRVLPGDGDLVSIIAPRNHRQCTTARAVSGSTSRRGAAREPHCRLGLPWSLQVKGFLQEMSDTRICLAHGASHSMLICVGLSMFSRKHGLSRLSSKSLSQWSTSHVTSLQNELDLTDPSVVDV